MKRFLSRLAIAVLALAATLPAAHAGKSHILYNQWKGEDMPLDIYDGGDTDNYAHVAQRGNVSGQAWKIWIDGDWVRLTTELRGDKMCLDVDNGGDLDNFVSLQPCDEVSGQRWKEIREGDWGRLTTEFRGPDMCLDIVNGG